MCKSESSQVNRNLTRYTDSILNAPITVALPARRHSLASILVMFQINLGLVHSYYCREAIIGIHVLHMYGVQSRLNILYLFPFAKSIWCLVKPYITSNFRVSNIFLRHSLLFHGKNFHQTSCIVHIQKTAKIAW